MELSDIEIKLLSNEHPALLKLYTFLKSKMNLFDFTVSGFSYSDIQNFMSVPSKKGKKALNFSRHQARYLLNQLIECGLIYQRRDIDSFCFELAVPKLSTDLSTHARIDTKIYQQGNTHMFTHMSEHTYPQKKDNNSMNNNLLLEQQQCNCAHTFAHRIAQNCDNVYELTKCSKFVGNKIKFNHYHFVVSESIYNNIIHIKKYILNIFNNNNKYTFATFKFSKKSKKIEVDDNKENVKKVIKDIFKEFWKLYPKKVAPQKCLRKFISICKNNEETALLILEGIKRYVPIYETIDRQFIPHPHTWLNGGQWEDDIQSQQRKYF